MKKISRTFSLFTLPITLLWIGCAGSSSGGAGTAAPTKLDNIPQDLSQKISSTGKMPAANDYKEMIFLFSKKMPDQTFCNYLIDEKTTVTAISATSIDFDFENSVSPAQTNSQTCPLEAPLKVTPHSSKHWDMQAYLQNKIDTLKKNIDTERFLKMNWVSAASIVQSQELEENGLRAQMIDIQITAKDGNQCHSRQYFSLDSVFLGRFEERMDCGGSNSTLIQQLKGISIKGLPHK